jgi:hypothetical protein
MTSRKEIDEIFEKPETKEHVNDDITLTDSRESLSKKKRQPRKPKVDINFEKEKNDFLSSLLSKKEDVPEQKKEVKTVENKERKLQLIENLKKAREQKKLNKQPKQEQPKQEQPKEIIKEQVKEHVKEDPEYLEWKKQRQQKQQEIKSEVKQEPVKIQEVKSQPIDIPKPVIIPQPEYIVRSTFKKPMWSR